MAGLIDLFAIGFNSDGIKDFEKNLKHTESELDSAEKKVKTLETRLQELEKDGKKDSDEFQRLTAKLKIANDEVKKFGEDLKKMQGQSAFQILKLKKNFTSLMKTAGQLGAVVLAVRKSMQFYEQAEQLDFLAQKSNIAVESLQRLGNAAQRYGGTTEGTASTAAQFTSREYKEKALSLGVRVSGDAEQTFENIARRMERLRTDAQKLELAKQLGLDEGTARMLMQGVDKYREELKRADKYKLYTKEDIARMKDYRQIQQDIRINIQNIQGVIARMLLPAITAGAKIIRGISGFFSRNEGIVKIAGVFIGIAAAIGAVTLEAKSLNAAMLSMIAWTAVITALIAVFQDLYTFIQGGDSLIGKLWESWGYDLENIRQGFEIWGERIKRWWNNFLSIFNKNIEWQDAVKDIDVLKDLTPEEKEKLKEFEAGHGSYKDFSNMIQKGQQTLTIANNNPLNSVSPAAISNSYQTQALTENNNQNTQNNINNNNRNAANAVKNNKIVEVNIGTVQTQASDGRQFALELAPAIADLDNGIVA